MPYKAQLNMVQTCDKNTQFFNIDSAVANKTESGEKWLPVSALTQLTEHDELGYIKL